MPKQGWKQLLSGTPWYVGEGKYPIAAYSEFMPPPRLGRKPCGRIDSLLFRDDDPWGWHVTEYEEAFELQPGLKHLAQKLVSSLHHLGKGEPAHGMSRNKLADNPYWPDELRESGAPGQERYVLLLPLSLSRTQDDKGRVRWTLFGSSEQGPGRAFWRGFYSSPTQELPAEWALNFMRRLLSTAYAEPLEKLADLRRAGFRIHSGDPDAGFPHWREDPLPSWSEPLRWRRGQTLRGVKYLLTFQAFARLPLPVRRAYQASELRLLPFPGSMVFWGTPSYVRLSHELPLAMQIPLLHLIERHEAPGGIRVPQSGWMHERRPGVHDDPPHGPVRNGFKRTHRWARVHRQDDELAVTADEDKVAHVLFSTAADDMGLYGKPMARNAQIWTHDHHLLLDGPAASRGELLHAAARLGEGGLFGYRFLYPAMRVERHEVYWHRPLVACLSPETGEPQLMADAPLGYLTAYHAQRPKLAQPVELWPRLLHRSPHRTAVEIFDRDHDHRYHRTSINVRKLLDTWQLFDRRPLEAGFARQLLTLPKEETLDHWLATLPHRTANATAGHLLADALRNCVADDAPPKTEVALTYDRTARRAFEEAYWNTISELATGKYKNKDNADCVLDHATRSRLDHDHRDLEALGDHLLAYYARTIAKAKMTGKALAGELPFQWRTDFDYHWSGGWLNNQRQVTHERDLVVVIPGRDRGRAVIMADHYDTAYMEDVYGYAHGGHGPRLAAAGADDNHSATSALMLGAPVFMELSRSGQLACDIWLVHLTGEEFPSDCMGARHLCQRLVERSLKLRWAGGRGRDLSKTRVRGVYVLDMVAHNNDHDHDVFQICPGASRESLWLAYQAHRANRAWNGLAPSWNKRPDRRGKGRGKRCQDGHTMPEIAIHPHLHGEVRPAYDPRSTLYNTDGQIFSDAGVPVVLFMENYDINRKGYHDTHDTLENIDLDYGAAVAAIAIESVARAATEQQPWDD
ncbi:MAG TPA: M28 family peptidase [Pirellulales bacterium]|nr:M28 family peptidase [Pirellulales bacterium]